MGREILAYHLVDATIIILGVIGVVDIVLMLMEVITFRDFLPMAVSVIIFCILDVFFREVYENSLS